MKQNRKYYWTTTSALDI